MADVVEQGERRGLSRRDLIKASAVAGAAAWTAPVIIDSLASPAAAQSGCTGPSVSLSWIYILFRVGGVYYVTGFAKGSSACNTGGANPASHGTTCTSCTSTNVSFTLNNFGGSPDPTMSDATYNLSGDCNGTQSNNWTFLNSSTSPTCGTYIGFNNGEIFSMGGAEILAAVGFGGNEHLRNICPDSSGMGNSVCGIEV